MTSQMLQPTLKSQKHRFRNIKGENRAGLRAGPLLTENVKEPEKEPFAGLLICSWCGRPVFLLDRQAAPTIPKS